MIEGYWGMGPGLGEALFWVECQRSPPPLNNDANREYLIIQSERFPPYLPWLERNCSSTTSHDSLLQLS